MNYNNYNNNNNNTVEPLYNRTSKHVLLLEVSFVEGGHLASKWDKKSVLCRKVSFVERFHCVHV